MNQKVFCFGVGYSGIEFLKHARAVGYEVSGCVRTQEKADILNKKYNFNIVALDALTLSFFWDVTHILITIPPTLEGYKKYLPFVQESKVLQWCGYISTTGVYGNTNGDWVDECSIMNPSSRHSQCRVEAEIFWLSVCDKTHIFRLPAIYGTGRSALDKVMLDGVRAIDEKGQVFNRIHIYDIAQTLIASMKKPNVGRVYNVVDDFPCSAVEPLHYACDLLGMKRVHVVALKNANLSPMAQSFYTDNRRVKNTRIKRELGVVLKYPTYIEGLNAIFDAGSA